MKVKENLHKNASAVHLPYEFNQTPVYSVDFFPIRPLQGESNFPESQTIPDQALSIAEILDRHTRGLRTPDSMIGYYDEGVDPLELDGVDFNSLDLAEKMDVIRTHKQKAADLRKNYNKSQKIMQEAELRSKIIQQHEAQKPPASQA